ncbi:hypothetical protein ACHQM5_025325 [Ranunculus cassubicifolius]
MAGILGSVRALGLVAIVAVMFSGVAEADNPCYHDCFKDCTSGDNTCMFNPQCIATCGITCGLQDTCKHGSRKVLRNSAKAVAIHSDITEKNSVGGNPCYGECVQNCLDNCGLNFEGCATCPVICGMRDTCKHKINSAKPEEALVIQSDTIKKNTVENVAGNPCYAECVQDCLNSCSFVGCAACPAICGTHNTCKDVKKVEINSAKAVAIHSDITEKNSVGGNPCYGECVQNCLDNCGLNFEGCATCPVICGMRDTCKHKINSAKPEEALVIQSDTIKKNTVENVAGNPCYAECVQDCLNSCSFVGCAACPAICGTHNTCKDVKKVEINSGKLEDVAKSHVGVEKRNILRLNTVADE